MLLARSTHDYTQNSSERIQGFLLHNTRIIALLKVSTKRTAEKARQTRKGDFLRQEQMPSRNNTNAPQNISFRRFCTAVTWQYSVLSALRPHKITRKSFALRCLAVPQCRFLVGARSLPQAILCIVKTNDTVTAEIGFAGPCSYCSCSAYRTWLRKKPPWQCITRLICGAYGVWSKRTP